MSVILLIGCRGETSGDPAPPSTATTTPTPVTSRGGDSDGEGSDPAAAPPPAIVDSEASESRRIIYSVPFEVQPDGFGFRNYGLGYPEGDFTIAELRDLFGDGVCSRVDEDGDVCIPTAEAQQWIADRNADMRAGHCIGFTVASYRFAEGDLRPAEFSPTADVPFQLAQEVPIMRSIALHGSLYWVKSVWSSEVSGTPREIVDALIALQEPVDLSIFLPGLVGGHSLLAYGVVEVEPQTYHILVYDNNFPGEEAYVEVDYAANTWRYDQGAVNPDQTAIPYEGDAATQTLRFIPLSAYEAVSCPFCPPGTEPAGVAAADSDAITLISILGKGELLVKTTLGTIGAAAGEIINEIPGAQLIFPRGQLAADGSPSIALPAGTDFTVEFKDLARVSSMSPNLSVVINRLKPGSENSRLIVNPDGENFEFQAGGKQSPSLSVIIRQAEASFQATLIGVDFSDGQGVSMGAAAGGKGLELRSQESDVADATLILTRLTDEAEVVFATTALTIQDGGSVTLDIDQWDGSGHIEVFADEDGDGEYDETPVELTNEPLDEVLQGSDAEDIGDIIDTLSPFIGDQGLEAILAGLAEQELTGQEIGRLLQPLQLPDEILITIIPPLELPVPEVGDLLFELRLETERIEKISSGLELLSEDETELRIHLNNLALYYEIISDWIFLNTDDLSRLVTLLLEQDLTATQLAQLLPRLGLEDAEIERVLSDLELAQSDLVEVVEELGVDMPPTRTPTPTLSVTQTLTVTVTPTLSRTITVTSTATPGITTTVEAAQTPIGTPTPDPYPGALPLPTGTPDAYPYPGPFPSPTDDPNPYPGNDPTATPDYDSVAYCEGDDLFVLVEEPTWPHETEIELWVGDELLFSGEIGPDDEPLEITILGPGAWEDLYLKASEEPYRVPLRTTIRCPQED